MPHTDHKSRKDRGKMCICKHTQETHLSTRGFFVNCQILMPDICNCKRFTQKENHKKK